jgi:hypothetical protein
MATNTTVHWHGLTYGVLCLLQLLKANEEPGKWGLPGLTVHLESRKNQFNQGKALSIASKQVQLELTGIIHIPGPQF